MVDGGYRKWLKITVIERKNLLFSFCFKSQRLIKSESFKRHPEAHKLTITMFLLVINLRTFYLTL